MISDDFKNKCVAPVARHEAGHWLAAYLFGWEPKGIAIKVPEEEDKHYSYAMTSHRVKIGSLDEVRDYARKRVIILYSGMYASSFNGRTFDMNKIQREIEPSGASYSDFWKAEEIYFFYYNTLSNPKSWNDEFLPIIRETEKIIVDNNKFLNAVSSIICTMAGDAGQTIELSYADLEAIYKESMSA
ncbi:hypothetical protein Q4R10_18625 [Morganella morganii]